MGLCHWEHRSDFPGEERGQQDQKGSGEQRLRAARVLPEVLGVRFTPTMSPDLGPNFTPKRSYYISGSNSFPISMRISGKNRLNLENYQTDAYQMLYEKWVLKEGRKGHHT